MHSEGATSAERSGTAGTRAAADPATVSESLKSLSKGLVHSFSETKQEELLILRSFAWMTTAGAIRSGFHMEPPARPGLADR
jgi:hypothetical protein